MPYKILAEEVSMLKKIGELTDQQGTKYDEHASVTYYFGDVVPDSEVAPTVVRAYDADDHHVRSIMERTDAEPTVPERVPSALPQPVEEAPGEPQDAAEIPGLSGVPGIPQDASEGPAPDASSDQPTTTTTSKKATT